jgi:hypothetical protein
LLGKSSSCLNHSVSPLLFQCPWFLGLVF